MVVKQVSARACARKAGLIVVLFPDKFAGKDERTYRVGNPCYRFCFGAGFMPVIAVGPEAAVLHLQRPARRPMPGQLSLPSEDPTNPEEELAVAIVADRPSYFYWTEDRVDNERSDHVSWHMRRLGPER